MANIAPGYIDPLEAEAKRKAAANVAASYANVAPGTTAVTTGGSQGNLPGGVTPTVTPTVTTGNLPGEVTPPLPPVVETGGGNVTPTVTTGEKTDPWGRKEGDPDYGWDPSHGGTPPSQQGGKISGTANLPPEVILKNAGMSDEEIAKYMAYNANKNNTATAGTSSTMPSIDDILAQIKNLNYKPVEYVAPQYDFSQIGAQTEAAYGEQIKAMADYFSNLYEGTKAQLTDQQAIQERAVKDVLTGRGVGRSTIAASYLAKPGEETNKQLAQLAREQAQTQATTKVDFYNKMLDSGMTEAQTAAAWKRQELVKEQAGKGAQTQSIVDLLSGERTAQQNIELQKWLANYNAGTQKSLVEQGKKKNWWENLAGATDAVKGVASTGGDVLKFLGL